MKNDNKKRNKEFGNKILNKLYEIDQIISVTIVGSFINNYNIDKIGDLDVVVVCKKLSKNLFVNCNRVVKSFNNEIILKKRKLNINTTFGPVKFNSQKFFTIHLMIYDIQGHKKHCINSPFTCFDWEKSKFNKGKDLKEIYPVYNIQLRDFFEGKRNSLEYLKDLQNNKISTYNYIFENKKILLEKKYFKLNAKNKGEFSYHIVKNLIINLNKFIKNKNATLNNSNFKKLFLKITKNDTKLWNNFNELEKKKKKLNNYYSNRLINLSKKFLTYFNIFLIHINENSSKIIFLRHQKTILNNSTYLGQSRNPKIINSKINIDRNTIYDIIFSSPLKRAIQTAEMFKFNNLIIDKNLNEIDYGLAEGLKFHDYFNKYPEKLIQWKLGKDPRFPEGENTKDVFKRILKFLNKRILKSTSNKNINNILVITHNVVLRCLIGYLLKININYWFKLNINHMEKFEFIIRKSSILPNFRRNQIKKITTNIYD